MNTARLAVVLGGAFVLVGVPSFDRKPTDAESRHWKIRFRDNKDGLYKIRRTMAWHKADGSFGPRVSVTVASSRLVKNINAFFAGCMDATPQKPKISIGSHVYTINLRKSP